MPEPTHPITTAPNAPSSESGEAWRQAGEAWGHAALDWAYLFEPYARDAVEEVLRWTGVGPGTRLLDVACGSGAALGRAERLGAECCGLDAAEALLEIATRRAPKSEVIPGDMFALPWSDAAFDVVVAFNGIWGGCDDAVKEMARVCRPGGRVGITFWGAPQRFDLLGYFMALGASEPSIAAEITDLATIADPGVAESLLTTAGFGSVERAVTDAILEFPDAATAWRALRSPGLTVPALAHVGEAELEQRVLEAIDPFRRDDGSYRLVSELVHVVGRRPSQ